MSGVRPRKWSPANRLVRCPGLLATTNVSAPRQRLCSLRMSAKERNVMARWCPDVAVLIEAAAITLTIFGSTLALKALRRR